MNYKKNPREMCERRGDEHTRNEGTTQKSQTFINWIAFVRLSMGKPLRSLFAGEGVEFRFHPKSNCECVEIILFAFRTTVLRVFLDKFY